MKRFTIGVAALVVILFSQRPSLADDSYYGGSRSYYYPGYAARVNHDQHHDDLEHRAYHRELDHGDAHRYPMTYWRHQGLHGDLNHQAFHDDVEHEGAHATGAYYPRQYSGYHAGPAYYYSAPQPYYRSGFSIYIGR